MRCLLQMQLPFSQRHSPLADGVTANPTVSGQNPRHADPSPILSIIPKQFIMMPKNCQLMSKFALFPFEIRHWSKEN